MLPDWDCCFNYEKHFLGRIWVCWNRAEVKVSVLDKSAQCINCHIHSIKENSDWFQSFIYGANKPVERRLLWQNLFSMKMMVSSKPWILDGDFNVVRFLSEKWGAESLNAYEVEFGDCLSNLEITDLNFSGCFYTWNNKSEGSSFVARKLDRVLVNEAWICKYGRICVDFLPRGLSDHSPAIISVGNLESFGPTPFKFFNFWLENKNYFSWITDCWNQDMQGVPMYRLCMKLKALKVVLKEKNCSCYGDIKTKVLQARFKLEIAQCAVLDSRGSADSFLCNCFWRG